MIILDTNVVSEPMRPEPDPRVLAWLAGQDAGALFVTAVTEAELRTGLAIMPEGRRREALGAALEAMLADGGVRDLATARALRDDLLAAHAPHLPQFA